VARSARTVSAIRALAVSGVNRAAVTMLNVSSLMPLSAINRSSVVITVASGSVECR